MLSKRHTMKFSSCRRFLGSSEKVGADQVDQEPDTGGGKTGFDGAVE